MNKKINTLNFVVIFLLLFSSISLANTNSTSIPGYSMEKLTFLFNAITRTGVDPNRMPDINNPTFTSVSDASLDIDDEEIVFVVTFPNGVTRIYPRKILVWHEVINDALLDSFGNVPYPSDPAAKYLRYTIVYSPLSGTVNAFHSTAGNYSTLFSSRGDLINANTVLYDLLTESTWSQLLAICIDGSFKGKRLDRIPVLWATWKGVKNRYYGKAEVLSSSTGFKRTYTRDPYGSYAIKSSYYNNTQLAFPLTHYDKRLPPKEQILGVEVEGATGAVLFSEVKKQKVINFQLALESFVAVYDEELNAVRIFKSEIAKDVPLTFSLFEDKIIDNETRSQWSPEGICTYGKLRDKSLTIELSTNAMWFSWAAFYPNTIIIPSNGP